MRKLDESEVKLTNQGIKMRKKIIIDEQETIEYNKMTLRYLRYQREYEDYTRPRKRKAQDDEIDKSTTNAVQLIEESKAVIKQLNKSLINGVETSESK